jgi:hypothetical protein
MRDASFRGLFISLKEESTVDTVHNKCISHDLTSTFRCFQDKVNKNEID